MGKQKQRVIVKFILVVMLLTTVSSYGNPKRVIAEKVENVEDVERVEDVVEKEIEVEEKGLKKREIREIPEEPEEVIEEIYTITEEGIVKEGGVEIKFESEEYKGFIQGIRDSIANDMKKGLESLAETTPTKDHIEIPKWGDILIKYVGREQTAYPVEDIKLYSVGKEITVKQGKEARKWMHEDIIPAIESEIDLMSSYYPVIDYSLAVNVGAPLNELELDAENIQIGKGVEVYPIRGLEDQEPEIHIYNTGVGNSIMVNKKYLDVMKGYHGESADKHGVKGQAYPGSVSILAYIATPRAFTASSVDEMSTRDFGIYEDLAVNLLTKDLVNLKNLTGIGRQETYADFKLVEDDLIVVPVKDGVVVVQPKFLEAVRIGGYEFFTGARVDFTGIFSGEKATVSVTGPGASEVVTREDGTKEEIPFEDSLDTFRGAEGFLDLHQGKKNPFIIYANGGNLPYRRIIAWLYGPDSDLGFKKEELKEIGKIVKNQMKEKGMKAEYKAYMREAGQGGIKVVKVLVPIAILGGVIGFVMYKKKTKTPEEKQEAVDDLLFMEDDE